MAFCVWHIAAQSQCGGMSAAGRTGRAASKEESGFDPRADISGKISLQFTGALMVKRCARLWASSEGNSCGGASSSRCSAARRAWPLAARAQDPRKPPTIGILGSGSAAWSHLVSALMQRLRELGYIENRNVTIEYRWTEGRNEGYAAMAAELVGLHVDIIVALGTPAIVAARNATAVIPIVFPIASDPVGDALVGSLARPGGNVTGLSNQQPDLAGKRLEILREIIPGLSRLAVLANGHNPMALLNLGEVQAAGAKLGLEINTLDVKRADDIAPAIDQLKGHTQAIYVVGDHSSLIIRFKLTRWCCSRDYPRCTMPEGTSKREVWFPTEQVSQTCSAALGITSIKFSRAQSPPTYPLSSRPSSSS